MKNIELQNLLKQFPDEMDVVIPDERTLGGVTDLNVVEITDIVRDQPDYGYHKIDIGEDSEKSVKAILLMAEETEN